MNSNLSLSPSLIPFAAAIDMVSLQEYSLPEGGKML